MTRRLAGYVLAGLLLCATLAIGQSVSDGGVFLPLQSYVLGGIWTFKNATPIILEGTTDDDSETTLVSDATADRTVTIPNATDTLVGKATTDTLTNKTLTAPVIATITNTGLLTLPTKVGGIPVLLNCGATGTGDQTCAPTAATVATKFYLGVSTLSSNAAVITFPTAFAATTSYQCVANDITTRANPVQMVSTSTTTATITNTTGASDAINWFCGGQ